MEYVLIKFITLVLSLHVGMLPVQIAVHGPVARLEMRLDGKIVGERTAPPWAFDVDLGRDLVPHRLEAVAFDEQNKELERASQWVNYARQSLEASLVLDASEEGQRKGGRVVWATADNRDPISIEVRLDGRLLEASSDGHFTLPSYDLSEPHHLQAVLLFPNEQTARAEAVFGGTGGEVVTTTLTALPVVLDEGALPDISRSNPWFEVAGEPVNVFSRSAVRGSQSGDPTIPDGDVLSTHVLGNKSLGSSLIIVRDTHIDRDLGILLRQKRERLFAKTSRILSPDDRVEFILTHTLPQDPRGVHRPQAVSNDFNELGLWNLLARDYPQLTQPRQQNIWWSLALAGKRAVDLQRPRVVLLVLSKKPQSLPGLSFEQAQIYLRSLRVPLFVWAPEAETLTELGVTPDRPYLGAQGMLDLFADVQSLLDRQRMIWIEGDYLPNEVVLSNRAPAGLRIAQ